MTTYTLAYANTFGDVIIRSFTERAAVVAACTERLQLFPGKLPAILVDGVPVDTDDPLYVEAATVAKRTAERHNNICRLCRWLIDETNVVEQAAIERELLEALKSYA